MPLSREKSQIPILQHISLIVNQGVESILRCLLRKVTFKECPNYYPSPSLPIIINMIPHKQKTLHAQLRHVNPLMFCQPSIFIELVPSGRVDSSWTWWGLLSSEPIPFTVWHVVQSELLFSSQQLAGCFFIFLTILRKLQRLLYVKNPWDHLYFSLNYSNQPTWHLQPCHSQHHWDGILSWTGALHLYLYDFMHCSAATWLTDCIIAWVSWCACIPNKVIGGVWVNVFFA